MSASPPRPPLRSFLTDLPREGRLLLSVVVVEFIGTGLVLPFWVVYLHEVRDFSLSTTGLLLGLQPLAGLLVVGPGGALIDRLGARLVLLGSLACVIAGDVVMAFATTVPVAGAGLALTGVAFGVSWPAAQTMVATVVPADIRQRYFGLNFTLLNLGIGIGGVVGGAFLDVHRTVTFQAIYLADAVSFVPSLFVLGVLLRHVTGRAQHDASEHHASEPARGSYREALRQPALATMLVVTFVGSFVGYAQLNSGMPAFARALGHVSTQGLGLAFAANTLVIVVLQLVVLQRIEGRRRTRVMVAMAVVWAVAWLCLGASALVHGSWAATMLVAACASVFALGETLLQPTVPSMTNDLTSDRLRGRTNALSSAAFQLPMVVAPPVAGWLIGHHLGAAYVALLCAGCAIVAVLAVLRLEPQLTPAANGVRAGDAEPVAAGTGSPLGATTDALRP